MKAISKNQLKVAKDGVRITRQMFQRSTGNLPQQDDLERCNCPKAGQSGHDSCGWCEVHNGPMFTCLCSLRKRELESAQLQKDTYQKELPGYLAQHPDEDPEIVGPCSHCGYPTSGLSCDNCK